MASAQAGRSNTLASPREFVTKAEKKTPRMVNVYEAGKPVPEATSEAVETLSKGSSRAAGASVVTNVARVARDPRAPQTRIALWNPLHDWTAPDSSDEYETQAGGEAGAVTHAGFGRIKKMSNMTEVEFYTKLTDTPDAYLAPKFCGMHVSNGKQRTEFIILEDLTKDFQKPAVLDLQMGQEHVGGGEAGTAAALGLRLNGQIVYTNDGPVTRDKEFGAQIPPQSMGGFGGIIEEFLRDASGKMRTDVANKLLASLDNVESWIVGQPGLRMLGSSLIVVYEGDITVESPATPVVKMIDFANVEMSANYGIDEGYLVGLRNLRWMTQRLIGWVELEASRKEKEAGDSDLRAVRAQLKASKEKMLKMKQKVIDLAPDKGASSSSKMLHEDIRYEELNMSVAEQEDYVIAGFLKAILMRHKINPGQDAFVELLQWRYRPLILDRVFVKDLFMRYGLSTSAVADVLKWKDTSDTRLRDLRYVYDGKLSANQVLPDYYELLVKADETKAMLVAP